jgi:spore germination protein KB
MNCIFLYSVAIAISQILGLKDYKQLVLPMAVIMIIYASIVFPSTMIHMYWRNHAAAAYSALFAMVFPLITWILAGIRGEIKGGEAASQ